MQKYTKSIVIGIIGLLFFTIILVGISIFNNKTVRLNDREYEIAAARLAARENAQDGTGELRKIQCEYLGKLAKEFNPTSNFIDCSSPDSIYLATPDTVTHKVVTLSDENHTATFTVDNEFKTLINYEFTNNPSAGFNKFGGRK